MTFINTLLGLFTQKRLSQIDYFKAHPVKVQRDTWQELLTRGKSTEYGKRYGFDTILTPEQYRERVPVVSYEEISGEVRRMMEGESGILWTEETRWFAKSSGTTDAKSKFIPVSPSALEECHFRGGKDVIAVFNRLYPEAGVFGGKTLALGGSSEVSKTNTDCRFGDLSAILISNTPFWANRMKTPDASIMLMSNWEEKIEKICETTVREDVRCLRGCHRGFSRSSTRYWSGRGKSTCMRCGPTWNCSSTGASVSRPTASNTAGCCPTPR